MASSIIVFCAARDLERGELGGALVVDAAAERLEPAQRRDHRAAARERRAARVGAELALAREPGRDHRAEQPEGDLRGDEDDLAGEVAHHRGPALVAPRHRVAHDQRHDVREVQHEGVHDALDQRHGDHVAVGDVRDLVAEDRLHLLLAHAPKQAGRDRDQAALPGGARGEGVHLGRVVEADLRHRQVGLLRELADLVVEPVEVGVAGVAVDELDAERPLGDLARHQERHDRRAHAPDQAEHDQPALVAREVQQPQLAQHGHHDRHHHHHGDVGENEEHNPLGHVRLL